MAEKYCQKGDTHIAGPWGNVKALEAVKDKERLEKVLTKRRERLRQRLTPEIRDVHARIKTKLMLARPGEHIVVFVDKEGGKGKNTFIDLAIAKDNDYLPSWNFIKVTAGGADETAFKQQLGSKICKLRQKDTDTFVECSTTTVLCINIPKTDGEEVHKWRRYLPGLEMALDGDFWDGRYEDKTIIMEPPPLVLITCNNLPEKALHGVTERRWKINDISTDPFPHLQPYRSGPSSSD